MNAGRDPATPPAASPRDGLRQRRRADGTWRLWWEPTRRHAAAGAVPVEFSPRQPGHAQREATRLAQEWGARAEGREVQRRDGRSVAALIADYRASRHYTRLRETTRASYDTDLRAIEAKWGPQPAALFDAVMMDAWYDALLAARGPFRALAILTMLRTLMAHAERRGWRPRGSNPCAGLEMIKPAGRRRVGTWAELDALLAAARTLERRARLAPAAPGRQGAAGHRGMAHPGTLRLTWRGIRVAILLTALAGQRQTDVRLATPADFGSAVLQLPGMDRPRRLWIWALTRSKRRNESQLALHPEVVAPLRVQLMLAGRGPGTLIWDETTGRPYSRRLLWDRWAAVRDLAAESVPSVATLQWRDLRRTFGHLARAGGAERGDVADVLGNTADTDATLAAVYMAPQLATTWRAASAIRRAADAPQPGKRKEA